MATYLMPGYTKIRLSRDGEGNREYKVTLRVASDMVDGPDGPTTVLNTPGLPVYGSYYQFGNDFDEWAWCHWDAEVEQQINEDEPNQYWLLTFTYSTKPQLRYCMMDQVGDPLLIPPRYTGSSSRYNEEARLDRFGNAIVNSAHERIHGPQVEFDHNRDTINIEINTSALGLELYETARDTVNMYPMWGLPERCIKLSNLTWDVRYQGPCEEYFVLKLVYETNLYIDPTTGVVSSGWDKHVLDEGTKSLCIGWPINPAGGTDGVALLYQGTGCTFTISVDEYGSITSASISDAGAGYAPSKFIALPVNDPTPGGGKDGVIAVAISDTGTVESVQSILSPGSGYPGGALGPGIIYETGTATGAIIPYLARSDDPSQFVQFKDRFGENTTVLLNAAGCPISFDEGTLENPGQHMIEVEYYQETDFLQLGTPANLF